MPEVRFSVNDIVKVKLTPFGREYLLNKRRQYSMHCHGQLAARVMHIIEDKDGWSEWQLWGLMLEFGDLMRSRSAELPFETDIRLVVKTQRSEKAKLREAECLTAPQ